MRIVFIGCVESSKKFIEAVYYQTEAEIVGVVSKTKSLFNSDHISLAPFAKENNIDYHDYEENNQLEHWIRLKKPDLIYCFGWSHILPISIYTIPKYGAVGYHPTLLPANRGRHPIIWALALGLDKTGSTFFKIAEDADAGAIISQKEVTIYESDDARTLYNRLLEIGEKQVIDMTVAYQNNTVQLIEQNHEQANSWRKRTKRDGLIDWRMTTESILRLIRSLTKPYAGAHIEYKGSGVVIWKANAIEKNASDLNHIEPGKVLESNELIIIVKTGDSSIELVDHEFLNIPEVGEYL